MGCGCGGGQRNVRGKHVVTKPSRAVSISGRSRQLSPSMAKQQALLKNTLDQQTASYESRNKLREMRKKIIAQKLGHA
jgi:hypothetical protein